MEPDTDAITTETERQTQHPKKEVTGTQWVSTNEWDLNERRNGANYHGWMSNGRGRSIPTTHHKGSFSKGGKPTLMEKTSRLILEVRHMKIAIGR